MSFLFTSEFTKLVIIAKIKVLEQIQNLMFFFIVNFILLQITREIINQF